jgi:hypothetical protein
MSNKTLSFQILFSKYLSFSSIETYKFLSISSIIDRVLWGKGEDVLSFYVTKAEIYSKQNLKNRFFMGHALFVYLYV